MEEIGSLVTEVLRVFSGQTVRGNVCFQIAAYDAAELDALRASWGRSGVGPHSTEKAEPNCWVSPG